MCTDLLGADERRHDAHVRRQEELQAHDEDGEDGERHQLQAVVHQLQRHKFSLSQKGTTSEITSHRELRGISFNRKGTPETSKW